MRTPEQEAKRGCSKMMGGVTKQNLSEVFQSMSNNVSENEPFNSGDRRGERNQQNKGES